MFTTTDAVTALKDGILKYMDESMRKAPAAVSDTLFQTVQEARHAVTIGGAFGPGRFRQVGEGEDLPARAPFERAEKTITPIRLGEMRIFSRAVMAQIMAALQLPGNPPLDIIQATDDWAKSAVAAKDQLCISVLTSTATGYDGKAMFATDHPQRSKTADGQAYNNTLAPAAGVGITDQSLKDALTRLQDTNAYSENGEPIEVFASHLIATTQNQLFDAQAVLRSVQVSGSNQNDPNVVQNLVNILLWRRLQQSTEYWYLACAKSGGYYQEQQGFVAETNYDFRSKNYQATGEFYGQAGNADFRWIVRNTVS